MIKSISIKNVASYDQNGVFLNDLNKINFIYGANGSGKTTISNFLAFQTNSEYKNCSIAWSNNLPLKCLVYNKKFRENNFGKGKIEGVFTLGEAKKDAIDLIEKKENELKILKEDGIKKADVLAIQEKNKETEENNFKESAWTKYYKKYEAVFKESFQRSMQKETFKTKLLAEFETNKSTLQTFDELKVKANTIFGEVPESIQFIKTISFESINTLEKNEIWGKKIIGKSDVDIAKLIQKLNMNDWVNQGKAYIQEDNICPFCQERTLTDDFKKQLERYFDESFTASIKEIAELSAEYNLLALNLINELNQIETKEKSNNKTKINIDSFSAYLKTLLSQLNINKELLGNKIKEPSRDITLTSTSDQCVNIEQLILNANLEIKKHNEIVNNFKSERDKLIQEIWKFIIEEARQDIEAYKKKINGLKKGIENLNTEVNDKRNAYKILNNEIKELNKNVTSIQPTVDEINKTLQYYEFNNFEIVPSQSDDGFYQIKRENGLLAESTLSEGEITFLTFLYFLQLAKGSTNKETISDERILVIDDPISSLDSNVLFVVSTLIKRVIKDVLNNTGNIRQIILLTHNVYFHKEVSFIDGRTKQNKDTEYWILRKNNKVSTIQSFKLKNPIQTSYELLWQEIINKDRNSGVAIQNTMRRIIENYFKILGSYGDDELIEKFTTKEEQDICRSLICWINDGSHSISDDLFIELQNDTVDKYLKVFEDIFILNNHKGHYDMMMGIKS